MTWPQLKQVVSVLAIGEQLLMGIFCMAVLEVTLGKKTGRRKRMTRWCLLILSMVLIYQLMNFGLVVQDVFWGPQLRSLGNDALLSWVPSGIFLLYYTLRELLPTALSFIGGVWLYRQERSVKEFVSLLTSLVAIFIHRYPYALLKTPFLRDNPDALILAPPPTELALLLFAICLCLGFWLYYSVFRRRFKGLLDTPSGRLDGFVKVPLLSVLVFAVDFTVLFMLTLSPDSTDLESRFVFIVVTGCLFFAYFLMYWAIFRGIALSTEAMKNRAELNVASNIQASMLPNSFPAFPGRPEFDIYATMEPAKEVGGDFYDFFLVDENHLAVVIADVSGKGVPAALFMVIAKTLLKDNARTGVGPDQVFTKVNQQLCEANDAGMFVTAWMGVLEIPSGRMVYVNAGHNPPLVRQGNCSWEYLKQRSGFVLAGMEWMDYQSGQLQLGPGDMLYLYTDGVTEATDGAERLYGEGRLKQTLDRAACAAPEQLLAAVKENLDGFVGEAPQFDDITMLALKINERST